MKTLKRFCAVLICILITTALMIPAYSVGKYPVVTDDADVLPSETEKYIRQKNAALYDKAGGRIFVYTMNYSDNPNVLTDDLARDILEQVSVEKAKSGVWTVIVIEAESGLYGYAYTNTSEKLGSDIGRTIKKCLKAPLSRGDLNEDVRFTVEQLADVYYDFYGVEEPDYTSYEADPEAEQEEAPTLISLISSFRKNHSRLILIFLAIFFIVLLSVRKNSKNNK